MRSVVCSTLFAAFAAACVILPSREVSAAVVDPTYAQVSVRAQVPGIMGIGYDDTRLYTATTSTYITNDLRQPGTVDSLAHARARSSTLSSIGVFAALDARRGTVVPPGQFPPVSSQADAGRATWFRVESSTLPLGAPVETTVSVRFDGHFSIADDSTDSSQAGHKHHADMEALVDAYDANDNLIMFYRAGAGYSTDSGFFDFSDWDGRFDVAQSSLGHLTASIDYTKDLTVQTTVGSVLRFELSMTATTHADIPNDVAMTVDFYNTGAFSFAPSDPSVRISALIPEPASLSLAGLMAVMALGRHRMRG